jgi:hypothetical protein
VRREAHFASSLRRPSEHQSQCAVKEWWDWQCKKWDLPPYALFAIPNAGAGAQRGQAGKMKAEGVRPGAPDLMLAVAYVNRGVLCAGLFIEMKRKPKLPSPEQREFHLYLRDQGYQVVVCWSAEEAILVIKGYLNSRPGGRLQGRELLPEAV